MLIYYGERDPFFPPSEFERMKKVFPHALLVAFPGVGHFPFLEAEEAFVKEVTLFFR
ncbi:MAG: alpha/beta fold hydrolase [Cyclobacteriaceae bacterium]|nr:alpha/beta fold hydrolase [Cyclobacteriaceae bacterium]UYN87261.1 MAG: alpha/beta fold hydrolase [Cyclobacteriaceae bacterium]